MTSKARVEFDPTSFGLRVAVQRQYDDGIRETLLWDPVKVTTVDNEARSDGLDCWLHLPEDDLRAIYEALGDHFGHAGHDIRALRNDYNAERARVDKLIDRLTRA